MPKQLVFFEDVGCPTSETTIDALTEDLAGSSGLDPEGSIRTVPGSANGFSKLQARRPGRRTLTCLGSANSFSGQAAIPIFVNGPRPDLRRNSPAEHEPQDPPQHRP